MVQGQENRPMSCRCQKVGIGEKSSGHRSIYKACDVPFSWWVVAFLRSVCSKNGLILFPYTMFQSNVTQMLIGFEKIR